MDKESKANRVSITVEVAHTFDDEAKSQRFHVAGKWSHVSGNAATIGFAIAEYFVGSPLVASEVLAWSIQRAVELEENGELLDDKPRAAMRRLYEAAQNYVEALENP